MKIACPSCKKAFEMEHVERGRKVQCRCSCKFLLDDASVLEDYSQIDEPPPKRIGPCAIERYLGRGGMGKVYKGIHPTLGIPVAVKTILGEYANDKAFKVRFIKSAKICAQVDHPNIVRIYDCGEDGGAVYLVLEYVGGGSVQKMLEKNGPLPAETIFEIAVAVCNGLVEAERHGIVHRDIKPENIMRSKEGEYKLSDLGLAKQRQDDAKKADPSLTLQFVSLGTPQYMPPEQAIDAKSCDCRADIYSLGVSLYELATGRLPFDSKEVSDLRRMHATCPPEPPSQINPAVPKDLERVILKCMEKGRDERYQSPEELLAEFNALKEGRPLPSVLEEEARRKAERRRRSLKRISALSVMLLAILAAAYAVWMDQWRKAGDQKEEEKQVKAPEKRALPASGSQEAAKDAALKRDAFNEAARRRLELWNYALNYAERSLISGDSFDSAIANLRAFIEDEDSKDYAEEAARKIEELAKAKARAMSKAMDSIAEKAKPLIEASELLKAANLYDDYAERLAKETAAQRQTIANSLREAARKIEEKRRAETEASEAKVKELLETQSELLLKGELAKALELASSEEAKGLCPSLLATLEELAKAPERIVDSFIPQTGTDVYINLNGARVMLKVKKVEGGMVYGEESAAGKVQISRKFDASALNVMERIGRVGKLPPEAKGVFMGLESFNSGNSAAAHVYFKQAGPLGPFLIAKLERIQEDKANAQAKAELLEILSSCGFKVKNLPGPDEFPDLAAWVSLSPDSALKVASELESFLVRNSKSGVAQLYGDAARKVAAQLEARGAAAEAPAAQPQPPGAQPVRRPPYKIKSSEDLEKSITQFNPQYFGGGQIELVQGRGFNIDLTGARISSLEPLRGLGVRTLIVNATDVSDLKPLKGLPLENLQFAGTKVGDLKPLEGMQLKCVAFSPSLVANPDDLQILRRMKSLETIGAPVGGLLKFYPAQEFWEAFDNKGWRR